MIFTPVTANFFVIFVSIVLGFDTKAAIINFTHMICSLQSLACVCPWFIYDFVKQSLIVCLLVKLGPWTAQRAGALEL